MSDSSGRLRVLYSFPLRLGADRICPTAWQQVMAWRRVPTSWFFPLL